MSNISLSFESRRGRLDFYLLPQLGMAPRSLLMALLVVLGVSLMFRLHPLAGAPLYLLGLALMVARGTTNKRSAVLGKKFQTGRYRVEWVMAAPKDLRKIRRKLDQLENLPNNWLNGLTWRGITLLLLLVAGFGWFDVVMIPNGFWLDHHLSIVFVQGAFLVAVFFFTHTTPWSPEGLKRKLDDLERMETRVLTDWQELQPRVNPMLRVASRGNGDPVPDDIKLFVRFEGAPKGLLGMQVQISFNGPNGSVLYLYCVILAERSFKPLERVETGVRDSLTIERGSDKEVAYVVVRQTASQTGGFETKPSDMDRLLDKAMGICRELSASGARGKIRM